MNEIQIDSTQAYKLPELSWCCQAKDLKEAKDLFNRQFKFTVKLPENVYIRKDYFGAEYYHFPLSSLSAARERLDQNS